MRPTIVQRIFVAATIAAAVSFAAGLVAYNYFHAGDAVLAPCFIIAFISLAIAAALE